MAEKKSKKKSRRLDASQRAHRLVQLVTGDQEDTSPKQDDKSEEKPEQRKGKPD